MASNADINRLRKQQKEAPDLATRKAAGKRLAEIKKNSDLMKAKARHQSKSR